jgi:AcrR family transcriptional regulator
MKAAGILAGPPTSGLSVGRCATIAIMTAGPKYLETVESPPPVDRLAARAGSPRKPGPRAMQTRARILGCVLQLVEELPYRELTTAQVTQRLGISPSAFYRYFKDMNGAILELTPRMRSTADAIAALVANGEWDRPAARDTALAVIDAMAAWWAVHRPLYRVTDLCADEGDARFAQVKAATFAAVTDALAIVIERNGEAKDHEESFAAACVVVAMLIHTMARETAFGLAGVGSESLRAQVAKVIVATVNGAN